MGGGDGMDIEGLCRQHDHIAAIAAELMLLVEKADEPRPVAALRWGLTRTLLTHLAVEDRYLYPGMIAQGGTQGAVVASRFQTEMGDLAERFTAYMTEWKDERIARDWAGFCDATKLILGALSRRIAHENETLYPLARGMRLFAAATQERVAIRG